MRVIKLSRWKVGGSCAGESGTLRLSSGAELCTQLWAEQARLAGGKFANWDIAVLQASCTGAEKKGFTELNKWAQAHAQVTG